MTPLHFSLVAAYRLEEVGAGGEWGILGTVTEALDPRDHVLCPQIVLDPGPNKNLKRSPQIGERRCAAATPKKVHPVALRFRRGGHLYGAI